MLLANLCGCSSALNYQFLKIDSLAILCIITIWAPVAVTQMCILNNNRTPICTNSNKWPSSNNSRLNSNNWLPNNSTKLSNRLKWWTSITRCNKCNRWASRCKWWETKCSSNRTWLVIRTWPRVWRQEDSKHTTMVRRSHTFLTKTLLSSHRLRPSRTSIVKWMNNRI